MKIKKIILSLILCILLTSCGLPGLSGGISGDDITVAGGNTTERQILAEMVKQMIEHYMPKEKVSIINNLGSTMLILQSLKSGNANISGAMYTGTSLVGELESEPETNPETAYEKVVDGYKNKFNMKWYPSYGFENTYAFMVTKEFSEKNNIEKISDLEKLSNKVRVGIDTSWLKRKGDGYEDFKKTYGFGFDKIYTMEIGLVYNAVKENAMEVVLGYSTDGRINSNNLVVLEDDKHLFPAYDASVVATYDILEKHPELDNILLKLSNIINGETMTSLNRKSDEDLVEPDRVAREFLEEHNYFEDREPIVEVVKE